MTITSFPVTAGGDAGRRFAQVDVFAAEPLYGNPVAVVLDADGLTDDQMLALARWTNLSETTFVLPVTDPSADYRVRIFTPAGELPFAGHPTLGTCHAWLEAGGRPDTAGRMVQECGAGLVPLRRSGTSLAFAAPALVRSGPVEAADLRRAAAVVGVDPDDVADAAWTDNGPGWLTLLLADADAVLALTPGGAAGSPAFVGVVGLHPPGEGAAIEVRAFFTDQHRVLREDPVTGSLNAAVAAWLLDTGRVDAPYSARQGTALGRRGQVDLDRDPDGTIWVAGATRTIVTGRLTL